MPANNKKYSASEGGVSANNSELTKPHPEHIYVHYDEVGVGEEFKKASDKAHEDYGRFNLAIVGNTGVGKSSLVNAVFGADRAAVGRGMPVTQGINYYHDRSLGVWDFEGFEIGTQVSPAENLRQNLANIKAGPKDRQISVVWYCILATADRLTEHDVQMIRELDAAGLPVILVLTKTSWQKHAVSGKLRPPNDVEYFKNWLENPVDQTGKLLHLPVQKVILTSTKGSSGKGLGHGLSDLVDETLLLAPESEKNAFRIAQRLKLPWKRKLARKAIAAATSASAGAAATPFPVTDATVLAPIQLAMMGRIAVIYDLELKTMLSASALAQFGLEVTGRALARSFIKLIPGVGSVVNASVAAALTAASGEAWMRLCEGLHIGKIDPEKVDEVWGKYAPTIASVVKHLVQTRVLRK